MVVALMQVEQSSDAEPQDPAAREVAGQLSAAVMVSVLLVVLCTCVIVLLGLRRRWRIQQARRETAPAEVNAWEESGKRVGLDSDPDVPREPGSG